LKELADKLHYQIIRPILITKCITKQTDIKIKNIY
jgi:hypothetical protein